MAVVNYDGYSAACDLSITPGSGGTLTSVKCLFRFMTFSIFTGLFSYATFCSASWESIREGLSGASFTWAGYVSGGSVYAAPGSFKGMVAGTVATMTYNTGCTIVFAPKVASDENSIGAFAESARVVTGRADGQPTITWVTV